MITVRLNQSITIEDGVNICRMEIDVDTIEELPAVDDFEGKRLHQGSIAWVISTGEFYGMQSDGTWINQANGEPVPASEPTAMSAPMRMMSAVKTETVEPESEVSEIEPLRETESDEDRLL